MAAETFSGGCQCGAVRFKIEGQPGDASVCHCRMCQKAFGSFYAPLVSTRGTSLTWTRGAPRYFQSSNFVKRGFCEKCGTPLSYEAPDGVALAIGAFDTPSAIVPAYQYGAEGKLTYADRVHMLPALSTMDDIVAASFLKDIVTFQHPDHDTDQWPPK